MIPRIRRIGAGLVLLAAIPAAAQTDRQAPPPAPEAPALVTAPHGMLTPVVGRHVRGPDGNDVGRVWDVLIDDQGIPQAAVIEYGGVLGVGKRKVAVAWAVLKFGMSDGTDDVTLPLTREQMGAIPDFTYGAGDFTIGAPGAGQ